MRCERAAKNNRAESRDAESVGRMKGGFYRALRELTCAHATTEGRNREEKEKGKRERSSLSAAIAVPQLGLEIAR